MIGAIAGFTGAGISGAAYIPQIGHLIKARCSAGMSEMAYSWWLIASMLVMVQAVTIRAVVFILLGSVQITAMIIIMVYTARYKNQVCSLHGATQLKGMNR